MTDYFHSVRLEQERCKGCVTCIKRCPTEAIRIRGGKAQITESRCIDCGECIRRCPNHAKSAVTDTLEGLKQYKVNVALPAPALYSQFELDTPVDSILGGLVKLGFDEVFEVAQGAEIVSLALRDYLKRDVKRPVISSACPVVVRLIQVKFPELLEHLVPIDAPVEVAARLARAHYARKYNLPPEQVATWFITPCPAKMTAVRQPLGSEKSNITGAIGISAIYGDLLKVLSPLEERDNSQRASWAGIGWSLAGGESEATNATPHVLVVDEIHSISEVFEQVALGKLKDIDYIEALACTCGCVGGPLTVENRFVSEQRMRHRLRTMKEEDAIRGRKRRTDYSEADLGVAERRAIEPRPIMRLDEDIIKAMDKVEVMESTLKRLPGLDCGSCGSPSCKALAEDIAQGTSQETDCVFKLRERVRDLAQEMVNLAQKLPPSLGKESESESGYRRD